MRQAVFAVLLATLLGLSLGVIPLPSGADRPRSVPPEETPAPPAEPTPAPEAPPVETPAPPVETPTPEPPPVETPTPEPAPVETPAPPVETPAPPAETPAPEPDPRAAATPDVAVAAADPTVTVCHATGSTSAPYVLVEAPAGGGEHAAHPDDIIPAPASGCPTTYQGPQAPAEEPVAPPPSRDVTLCHAVGRTYVELTIRENRVAEHERHRLDIIPAPDGGCPAQVAGDDEAAEPAPKPAPKPRRKPPAAKEEAETQPAVAQAPAPTPEPVQAAASATVLATTSGLPTTGVDLALWAMFGLGLVSMGAGLRLLTRDY